MNHQESLLSSSSSSSSSPSTLWHPLHQVSNLCRLIHHQPPIRCKAPAVATHWLWTNLKAALVRTKSTRKAPSAAHVAGTPKTVRCGCHSFGTAEEWTKTNGIWTRGFNSNRMGGIKTVGKGCCTNCTFMEYVSHFHAAYQTEPVKYIYYVSWEK